MSIIERAAGRLKSQDNQKPAVLPPAAEAQTTTAPVVQATAAPVVQTTAAPVAQTMAAPAVQTTAAPVAQTTVAPAVQTAAVPEPLVPPASTPVNGSKPFTAKRIEINLARLTEMGYLTPGGRSLISEQFRMIKRPLIKQAFAPRVDKSNAGNLIMVTSALPGEGKTFCSINLALSIAMELDHTVLLVDVDVARPTILRTFDVNLDEHTAGGLMDLLLDDKLDMGRFMLKTNVDTLSVLPVGLNHSHSTELLASQAMEVLLEEIASRYPDRIVIFDAPPLLVTSEASVLASKMGQIVLVVGGENTTQQSVKSSLDQLKGCKNVNLVYNKSMAFSGAQGYGYKYDV